MLQMKTAEIISTVRWKELFAGYYSSQTNNFLCDWFVSCDRRNPGVQVNIFT